MKIAYDESGAIVTKDNSSDQEQQQLLRLKTYRTSKELRRSRKDRVHPSVTPGPSSRRMENGANSNSHSPSLYKNKKPVSLSIDTHTNHSSSSDDVDEHRAPRTASTPSGYRGSRDLRSPGVQKTPLAKQAAKMPQQQNGGVPDFITQTDANGNATTPRSAQAIDGARKVHPSGPKPHLHVSKNGKLTEDDEDDDKNNKDEKDLIEETCVTVMDSIKFMCCCLLPPDAEKCLTSKATEDSDDKSRVKLLGDLHPEDTGKKCLVLDLDETLVHSSFRAVPGADFVIPVQVRRCIANENTPVFRHILANTFSSLSVFISD